MQILENVLAGLVIHCFFLLPVGYFIIRYCGVERITVEQVEKEIAEGTHNIYGKKL